MPTTCDNLIVVTGPAATVAWLRQTMTGPDSMSNDFPISLSALAEEFGAPEPTWYGGEVDEQTGDGKTTLTVTVETAWSPATGLVTELARRQPDLEVEITFLELEQGYAGAALLRNGSVVGAEYASRTAFWIESIVERRWPKWLDDVREVVANGAEALWTSDPGAAVFAAVLGDSAGQPHYTVSGLFARQRPA